VQGNSLKTSPSEQKPGKSKGKSKADSFVWTDDEVKLLLKAAIEYKVYVPLTPIKHAV